MTKAKPIIPVQICVPAPLRKVFDYTSEARIDPGTRVLVSFGNRVLIGISLSNDSPATEKQLKPVKCVIDTQPVFDTTLIDLLQWASRYYHHPVGEVFHHALPPYLRSANQLEDPDLETVFRRSSSITDSDRLLARAPRQRSIYDEVPKEWTSLDQLASTQVGVDRSDFRRYLLKLVERELVETRIQHANPSGHKPSANNIQLNVEQKTAVERITKSIGEFKTHVLYGITGSGKTEVYLHAAEKVIADGDQVLVLVPEISLTPQLVDRFRERLGTGVFAVHSGMSDRERYRTWWHAREGSANVVLGTRSAIFIPLHSPGLIIVDEEHDTSLKQQDGFRYHARDLAIKRASISRIPVILGSATPSMETMENASSGRYDLLKLSVRTGTAKLPDIELLDLRQLPTQDALSQPLVSAISSCLGQGQQALLFINRRGYAPVSQCGECGWQARCDRCDSFLTYHSKSGTFRCHHCGKTCPSQKNCPSCERALFHTGAGTQRIEKFLQSRFPEANISRLDRDEITSQRQLEQELTDIAAGKTDIVIGTQLISKGHDFPGVTLVGVVDSDQGLYSVDFRAPERLFQQLIQVAGRAGRSDRPGNVIIQTHHPDNPYLQIIRNHQHDKFYETCSAERNAASLPPYSHFALWRAESIDILAAHKFLGWVRELGYRLLSRMQLSKIEIMDPVSSPMEKMAGRFRHQLLVKSMHRGDMHRLLSPWVDAVENSKQSKKVRWSIDVDPMDLY